MVGSDASSRESRVKAVETTLAKSGFIATELVGTDRDRELKSFVSGSDWYRGADVDKLSKQEAKIIAARLVHRVRAKVAVPEENAKALEIDLASLIERGLIGRSDSDGGFDRHQLETQGLKVARQRLDEKGFAAFQEAVAKGYRPQPEDQEEPKAVPPDCCSKASLNQS